MSSPLFNELYDLLRKIKRTGIDVVPDREQFLSQIDDIQSIAQQMQKNFYDSNYEENQEHQFTHIGSQAFFTPRQIVDNMVEKASLPMVLCRLPDGCIIKANQSFQALTEYPQSDLLERPLDSLAIFPELEAEKNKDRSMLSWIRDGEARTISTNSRKQKLVIIHKAPIHFRNDECLILTFVDITYWGNAEVKYKKIQDLLEQTQRISKVGGWEYDVQQKTLIWTDETYRLHGVQKNSYDSSDIEQNIRFYGKEDRKKIENAFYDAIHKGRPYDLILKFYSADGKERWVRTIGNPEKINGETVRVTGNIMDITELVDTQIESERKANRLATLLEISNTFTSKLVLDQVLDAITEGACQLGGFDSTAIYLRDDQELRLTTTYPPLPNDFPEAYRTCTLQNHPHIHKALNLDKPIIVQDTQSDELTQIEEEIAKLRNLQAIIYVSIRLKQNNFGVLILGYSDRSKKITLDDIEISQTLANQAAIALENSRLYQQLRIKSEKIKSASLRLVHVQNYERRRISVVLHDRIGQNLAALGINLKIIQKLASTTQTEQIETIIADSQELIKEMSSRTHHLMAELHPPELDLEGLQGAIRGAAQQFSNQTGIEITLDLCKDPKLLQNSPDKQMILYRTLQESLTNIMKHAKATHVRIALKYKNQGILLRIEDNGIGFSREDLEKKPREKGWGLITMQDRIEAVGGKYEVNSSPGKGTEIIATIEGNNREM